MLSVLVAALLAVSPATDTTPRAPAPPAADSAPAAASSPRASWPGLATVRVTLGVGDGDSAATPFEAQAFELNVRASSSGAPGTGEATFVKAPGLYTGELARRGANGDRLPFVTIEVLDDTGAVTMTFRLTDVQVRAQRIALGGDGAGLVHQRLGIEETLAQLRSDLESAQRAYKVSETLSRRHLSSDQELADARARVEVLQKRLDVEQRRHDIVERQIAEQSPVQEQVTLAFSRLQVDSPARGGQATVTLAPVGKR